MSVTHSSQTPNDFYSLNAATWQYVGEKAFGNFDEFSGTGEAYMECCEDEAYVPLNTIEPEVYAMIAAWEAFEISRMKLDEAAGDALDTTSIFCRESDRLTPCRPPKRYYLTFWRSVTQRIIKLKHSPKSCKSNHQVMDATRSHSL